MVITTSDLVLLMTLIDELSDEQWSKLKGADNPCIACPDDGNCENVIPLGNITSLDLPTDRVLEEARAFAQKAL